MTTTIMGDDVSLAKEVKILGRRLAWHRGVGISYEADPKHAAVIVRDIGAEGMPPLRTPIVKEWKESEEQKI